MQDSAGGLQGARGATLVMAKLDRLSRDVADISGLMKVVDFKVATMPSADKFQLHTIIAVYQENLMHRPRTL